MKKIRVLSIILCVFALFSLLTGCSREDEAANARLETATRGMLDAIIADDADLAYAYLKDAATEADFASWYAQVREMLGGAETYTLEPLKGETTDNGYGRSFLVTATGRGGEKTYALTAYEKAGVAGFSGFYFQENVTYIGTLTAMGKADAGQWCTLIFGMLAWVLPILAVIDCYLHAKEKLGMMLLIILLGMVSLSFTLSPAFAFSLQHGYNFPYTALVYTSTGEHTLRLFLPVGAIGYFIFRRRILS